MDENTHVRCTKCRNIKYNLNCKANHGDNFCDYCPCGNCDCMEIEESKTLLERHGYIGD